jgi:hypothetical protein
MVIGVRHWLPEVFLAHRSFDSASDPSALAGLGITAGLAKLTPLGRRM